MLACISLVGCEAIRVRRLSPPPEQRYMIVDCLLPDRLVPLPGMVGAVALPRSPSKTTAESCLEQGGDYRVIDRDWSLKVWTPKADAGDAEAQYYVGTIYDGSAGSPPDLERAAKWYRKAAEQKYRPAAARLARLYELGTGVPQNWAEALRWYLVAEDVSDRRAIVERMRRLQGRLQRRQEELRQQLEQRHGAPPRDGTRDAWRLAAASGSLFAGASIGHVADIGTALDIPWPTVRSAWKARVLPDQIEMAEESREDLQKKIADLEAQNEQLQRRVDEYQREPLEPLPPPMARGRDVTRHDLGKFYAVVIGNKDYVEWDPLETSVNDARAIKQVLEGQYGFETPVELIANGDHDGMLGAIERIRTKMDEDAANGRTTSFLLFYGGHGDRGHIAGHWIPIDAPKAYSLKWIDDVQIAEQLIVMKARQILVVADSCYGNTMARGSSTDDDPPLDRDSIRKQKPRMILSGGGDQPVYEAHGAEHSVFTREILDVLTHHHGVLTGQHLFAQVVPMVERSARVLHVQQHPSYDVINMAGHTSGDFIMVAD